jgi:hypothetical protein
MIHRGSPVGMKKRRILYFGATRKQGRYIRTQKQYLTAEGTLWDNVTLVKL